MGESDGEMLESRNDVGEAYEKASDKLSGEGFLWDGCLGSGDVSPNFEQRFMRAIDLRFLSAIPGINIGDSVKLGDERLLRAFRPFNSDVGLSDIRKILDSAVDEVMSRVKARQAGASSQPASQQPQWPKLT